MKRTQQIWFMIALGVLLTVVISLNARLTILRLVAMNNWEVHTHRVLNKTHHLAALLTHIDNDLRAYLVSNQAYFKTDFERHSRIMGHELGAILSLTRDNPAQTKRINQLISIFRQKLSGSQALLAGGGGKKGRAHLDSLNRVLTLSNRFQQLLAQTETVETRLLNQRMAASKQSASYALLSQLVGAAAALGMILWAIYLLYGSLQKSNQLNQQLVDREQQTKRLLEAVPVSVVIVDQHGQFYYANQAASQLMANLTDCNSYADFGRSASVFRYPGGEVYPLDQRPTYRSLRGESVQVDDLELRLNDRAVQLLTSSSPVYNAQGELQYVITTSIDISERVQAHQRLEEAKKMAETATRVKQDFLANMSHEIRTPLNAILGFSELLDTTQLDTEQQDFVRLIRTAGKNLLTIVNDILDIAKLEAGKIFPSSHVRGLRCGEGLAVDR
jgi:signal transduction histidine kinase